MENQGGPWEEADDRKTLIQLHIEQRQFSLSTDSFREEENMYRSFLDRFLMAVVIVAAVFITHSATYSYAGGEGKCQKICYSIREFGRDAPAVPGGVLWFAYENLDCRPCFTGYCYTSFSEGPACRIHATNPQGLATATSGNFVCFPDAGGVAEALVTGIGTYTDVGKAYYCTD